MKNILNLVLIAISLFSGALYSASSSSAMKISERLKLLHAQDQSIDVFERFIRETPDKKTLVQEIADDYVEILRSGIGVVFIPELFKSVHGAELEPLRSGTTKQFAALIQRSRDTMQAGLDVLQLLRSDTLNWAKLPQVYDKIKRILKLALNCDLACHSNNIKGILIHAPKDKREEVVKQVLRSCGAKYLVGYGRKEFNMLAQFVAEMIVLFDVKIDVFSSARDDEFRNVVLSSMNALSASYDYCAVQKIGSQTTPLRNWIINELEDEQRQIIGDVQSEMHMDFKDELEQVKIRQAMKKCTGHVVVSEEECVGLEYFQEKLRCMKLNVGLPIITPYTSKVGVCMILGFPSGQNVLQLPQRAYHETFPLAMNWKLAHEMIHYYCDDAYFRALIEKKIKEGARHEVVGVDLPSLKRFNEKRADLWGGLYAGPEACRALAADCASRPAVSGDPHLNGKMRAAALIDLARLMEDEASGKPFEIPNAESPLVAWLAAKGKHPL